MSIKGIAKTAYESYPLQFFVRHIYLILWVATALCVGVVFVFDPYHTAHSLIVGDLTFGGDYRTYYTGGLDIMKGGAHLYDRHLWSPLFNSYIGGFVYPPLMALYFVPFSLLPFALSYIIHSILSIGLLIASCVLLSRLLTSPKLFCVIALPSFFLSPIFVLHLDRGQTDIMVSFLLVAALYQLHFHRSLSSGFFLGIAAALKVTPIIFLAYLLWRDRKAFFVATGTIIASIVIFPINLYGTFLRELSAFASGTSSGHLSNSIQGVFFYQTIPEFFPLLALISVFLIVSVVALFLFLSKPKHTDPIILLMISGILVTFMMIAPSTAWAYNGVHSLILFAAYWEIRTRKLISNGLVFVFDILAFCALSAPLLLEVVRSSPLRAPFVFRPLVFFAFLILFAYVLLRQKMPLYKKAHHSTTPH
ncbi:hypothetical protein A2392_00080 [Candidatus Kaiserbacteria bacterium RIFOXYB1_FULL_46_14]|uniref:DUF2029 domain-containing protein n=1 Tax=Candidatus Kaiserbacteria bacterium RIFOXYB1_FULL_46_14 TaxID=1798531 RepID=A0A1F6FHY1_9BACT|nr:MAG: hypothetical protein A2392_00080 [Candidatus Kaiserbacteria bacterium RIFOXYB1_FULL_46_14]